MNNGHKRKLVFLLLAAGMLVFYVRTIPQISLNERAIVIGIGIDYADGKYTVSTQIINPSSASQTGSSNDSYGVLSGSGKTLTEAIVEISHKTGLTISLSQCNVLVLGSGVPQGQEFPSVNYLVQNYQIPEQAVMLATDKKAIDIFRATPVLTTTSAFQLQQTLTSTEDSSDVMHTNIKNFVAGYVSKSRLAGITYIVAKEVETDDAGGSESSSSKSNKFYEFNYDRTLLYTEDKPPMLLEKEDTTSINLFIRNLKRGSLIIELDGEKFSLQLTKSSFKDKCKLENGRLKFDGKLKVSYNIAEVSNLKEFSTTENITDELLAKLDNAVKQTLEAQIISTYMKCRDAGFDVFLIYNKAYSAEGVKWKNVASDDDYLSLVDFKIDVTAKVTRK